MAGLGRGVPTGSREFSLACSAGISFLNCRSWLSPPSLPLSPLLGGSPARRPDDRVAHVVRVALLARAPRPSSRLTVPRLPAVLLAGRPPRRPCSSRPLSGSRTSAHLSPQLFFRLLSYPLPTRLPHRCAPELST